MHDKPERCTILAVDDEPQILHALEDLLEEEFDVFTAPSAQDALEILAAHPVNVIVSDQRMPGMEGDAFLAQARLHSSAARILLTGYADFAAVVRAVNDGQIYAYVAKPWDPVQFKLTVRRAAEHAVLLETLAEERRLLRILMENVPDKIFFKDRDLRFIRANRMMASRLGVDSADDLVGHEISRFVNAESNARIEAEERRIIETGEPLLDDARPVLLANGQTRWYAMTKVPFPDGKGRVEGLVAIGRDIHDRHQAEQELQRSEERFRDFAACASDWFWEMDEQLRFTELTASVEDVIGVPAAALIGRRREELSELVEAPGHSLAAHTDVLAARQPFRDFVYGRRRDDGRIGWVTTSGRPRFDEQGRFLGYRGTGCDVTAKREAQAALHASEQRVRLLLESTVEGIYGVDIEGCCNFVNPAALQLLGYAQASDLLGRRLHAVIHHSRADGSPYPRESCPFSNSMGKPLVIRSRSETLWRADGTCFHAEVSMHPIMRAGQVDGAVVSFVDISERHRAESMVGLVNRIAVALGETGEIDSALEVCLRLVCDEFGWRLGEAWQPVDDGTELVLTAVSHEPDATLECFVLASEQVRYLPGHGLPGRVWQSREEQWVPNPGTVPDSVYGRRDAIAGTGLKSVCAIPVQAGGDVVAVLLFYGDEPNEEDSLRTLALTAAVAPLGALLKRISAEDALREADARLNLALDSAKVGTWEWRLETDELEWDAHMLPLYGVTAASVPRTIADFNALIHPEDREALAASIEVAIGECRDLDVEFRIVRPCDAQVRMIAARGCVYRDSQGGPARMSGVNWDVTDEREAQAEVGMLARVYLENPNPVLRLAADGQVLLSNPASARLLEAWGTADGGRVPSDLAALLPQVLGSGKLTPYEFEVEDRVIRVGLVPVQDEGYVNAYGEDVTAERKSAERIRLAQKMEAVGQLTGGIAHDFNNRLMVISGNLELLEMGRESDDPSITLIGHARRACDGAAKLTSQLLTFARRQVQEPESVDVNEHMRGLEEMIGRSLGETVALEFNLCSSTWPVLTDPGQLEDALLNLCVNARDAMPDGGRLTLETDNVHLHERDVRDRPYVTPGDYVLVAVSDTGCGMTPEIVDRVFEPFFTTKPVGKGTGLGLSMVYGFAKQSGGHVHIYSEVGHGTCFKIYLPRLERREVGRADDDTPALVGGGGRLLVVEDDEGARLVATRMLSALGYTVEAVENAPAAIARLESDPGFELVFTDVIMPGGMTGFDLAEVVRERWPDVRLLFTSGYTDRGPFKASAEQLGVDWVPKPYTHAKLAAKVAEVLARTDARNGESSARQEPGDARTTIPPGTEEH